MAEVYTLGAFAVILDEHRRVLLCHRTDKDLWNLPGGGLEVRESPWSAVVREVREEVGLEVVVERLVGVYAKEYENNIVFLFLCKPIGGGLTLSGEADRIEYFSLENIPPNTNSRHIERIRDVFDNHKMVVLKTHIKEVFYMLEPVLAMDS